MDEETLSSFNLTAAEMETFNALQAFDTDTQIKHEQAPQQQQQQRDQNVQSPFHFNTVDPSTPFHDLIDPLLMSTGPPPTPASQASPNSNLQSTATSLFDPSHSFASSFDDFNTLCPEDPTHVFAQSSTHTCSQQHRNDYSDLSFPSHQHYSSHDFDNAAATHMSPTSNPRQQQQQLNQSQYDHYNYNYTQPQPPPPPYDHHHHHQPHHINAPLRHQILGHRRSISMPPEEIQEPLMMFTRGNTPLGTSTRHARHTRSAARGGRSSAKAGGSGGGGGGGGGGYLMSTPPPLERGNQGMLLRTAQRKRGLEIDDHDGGGGGGGGGEGGRARKMPCLPSSSSPSRGLRERPAAAVARMGSGLRSGSGLGSGPGTAAMWNAPRYELRRAATANSVPGGGGMGGAGAGAGYTDANLAIGGPTSAPVSLLRAQTHSHSHSHSQNQTQGQTHAHEQLPPSHNFDALQEVQEADTWHGNLGERRENNDGVETTATTERDRTGKDIGDTRLLHLMASKLDGLTREMAELRDEIRRVVGAGAGKGACSCGSADGAPPAAIVGEASGAGAGDDEITYAERLDFDAAQKDKATTTATTSATSSTTAPAVVPAPTCEDDDE